VRPSALTKERVTSWVERHFLVRLHMTFILTGTFLAGLAGTKVLLALGVTSLPLRYALAVCGSYLVFLVLIRLWLAYVGAARGLDFQGDGIDWSRHGAHAVSDALSTGGGGFGGGGATGTWGQNAASVPAKGGGGGGGGGGFSLDADEFVIVILFLALVLSLVVIGIYVIYTAPALLGEAAFEALLAGALARRARGVDRPGWVGVVWRATVWPFLLVLVLTVGLGWAVQRRCPDARVLRDAFRCGRSHKDGEVGGRAALRHVAQSATSGLRERSSRSSLKRRRSPQPRLRCGSEERELAAFAHSKPR
jgi:hypothetical protein